MVLLEVLGQFCNTENTINLDYLDFENGFEKSKHFTTY